MYICKCRLYIEQKWLVVADTCTSIAVVEKV